MTQYEQRMLELREREVNALEMQTQATTDNARRNGPENKYFSNTRYGHGLRDGYWKYGTPDTYK